ncbi:MFS transporter [Intrasporangium calvum]|uniref:MFS transporter n=1 Tax=Intrasporangium calvum TaxID=53358 RepID=UPI000DF5F03A|nr:MFS transporter [Intrasporangium calvum]AXG15039.1 MFS transporter [Intrasporangium calvum]
MKELLRIRDARIALGARALSQLGDAMTLIALSILIAQTGQPLDLTVLLVAFAAPVVALSSWAGRLVDTRDSRHLLTAAALVQVAGSAGLLASTSLGWQVGCILVIQSGQAVAGPGWGALLPRIVGEEKVGRAIGLQQALGSAAWLAGTALGGLAFAAVGFHGVILIDTLAFGSLVGAALAVRTHRAGAGAGCPAPTPAPALESGWRILHRDRVSGLVVAGLVLFVVALEGTNVVEAFLVIDVLGAGPAAYGLLGLCLGTGVTVGSVLCTRIDGDRRRIAVLSAAAGTLGLTIAAAGLVGSVAWLYPLFVVAGLANGFINGLGFALVVGRTADAARGRVLAAAMGTIRGGSVVSLLVAGVAAGWYGPRAVFVGAGLLTVTVAPVLLLARGRRAWAGHGEPADASPGVTEVGAVEPAA